MKTSLTPDMIESVSENLEKANSEFNAAHPGESTDRQPVHTVYGGAHIFQAESAQKIGAAALKHLKTYAPTFSDLAQVLEFPEHEDLAQTVYQRVVDKLEHEPVEDFRIDFEDGYGNRPDDEEDSHSVSIAEEVARGMAGNSLPPFIGVRIKPLTEELKSRAIRTLDLFLSTLLQKSNGTLPQNFVVTLPKVTIPEQVSALVSLFEGLEKNNGLPHGSLKLELMIETPQSILDSNGNSALPTLIHAADGRCTAAHFGVYDYTASSNITAAYQGITHPACDFARHMMQVALAGTGVRLSDGATNILPIGPHRPDGKGTLTEKQQEDNRRIVHQAWKQNFSDIHHSLQHGYYQGWDLHPSQLPVRYAAVYSFFLEGLEAASHRLNSFMDKAAQATLVGDVFDDAATGQALLNYFLRGISCGAITEEEVEAAGLSLEEIRLRSFNKILQGRQS